MKSRKRYDYPQTEPLGGSYRLAKNDVWNVPAEDQWGGHEVVGPWQITRSYRAVAIDSDGYVFGERQLRNPREEGHCLEGTVSVCGQRYWAFTSSTLFQYDNKTLVNVATLHVCIDDEEPIPFPRLSTASDKELGVIADRYHFHREGPKAAIQDYARMVLWIRKGDCPHAFNAKRLAELAESLPEWVEK